MVTLTEIEAKKARERQLATLPKKGQEGFQSVTANLPSHGEARDIVAQFLLFTSNNRSIDPYHKCMGRIDSQPSPFLYPYSYPHFSSFICLYSLSNDCF